MKHPGLAISKVVAAVIFAVLLIIVAAIVLVRNDHSANSVSNPTNGTAPTSTDPVKRRTGNNGDSQPSSSGVTPGGNNSLLSQ